ncbi:MAG TPA: hypothetical protein VEC02_06265 [Nitrososphaerales archaeon]|nr:hypothetical protein [Nitrososphaerales archaeon]
MPTPKHSVLVVKRDYPFSKAVSFVFACTALANILDAIAIAVGLGFGLVESDPLGAWFLNGFGLVGLLGYRGATGVIFLVIAYFFRKRRMSRRQGSLILIVSMLIFVAYIFPLATNVSLIILKVLGLD